MDMNILDYTFALMDSENRPIEFGVIFHLKTNIPKKMLEAGANRALALYPIVGHKISGTKFIPISGPFQIEEYSVSTEAEKKDLIDKLLSKKIKINHERLLRQYLIHCNGKSALLSHMHHALGDGVSIIFWLQAQLGGHIKPASAGLEFKAADKKEKISKWVFDSVSDEIKGRTQNEISSHRKITSFFITPPGIEKSASFTYNDYLIATIMKSLRAWDEKLKKISVWTPMNIRKNPFLGFGNGSSRIRLYDRTPQDSTLGDLSTHIREQVKWNKEHGVWQVSASKLLVKIIHLAPFRLLLKRFLSRPSLDVGTTIFSHIELFESDSDYFHILENIEVFNMLHSKIPLSMVAVGFGGKTNFTITYDSNLFSPQNIEDLKAQIIQKIK